MKQTKKLLALLLSLAMVLALAACGSTTASSAAPAAAGSAPAAESAPSVVNVGVTDTLSAVNPLLLDQSEFSKIIVDLQYQPLCELNSELEFVGLLADSITTDDNLHFTVHINEAANWSDGTPITADDVVFTVLKFASPTIANPYMLLYAFEGVGEDGFTAPGATAEDLTGVAKVDDKTVVFTANYPMPLTTFESTYGRYIHVLPSHVLSSMSDEELLVSTYFENPEVISGPYRLTSYDTSHYVTFTRNEAYWNGVAKIEYLNFNILDASQLYAAFSSGEIDFAQQTTASIPFDDYANIAALENVNTNMGKKVTNQSLFIQTANITDVRVRQAILCGIDRETLVSGYLNGYGEVVEGFLSSASPFYSASLVPTAYDKARAAELVAAAAADDYDVSAPIDFYTNAGDTTMTNVAAYIASGLGEIGLNVQVHTVDFSTLMSVAGTEEVDMFAVQYTYVPVDPYPDVAWLLSGEGSWTGYWNDAVAAALTDSQSTSDLDRTIADFLVVDQAMQDDVAMISLYIQSAMGVCSKRLQNATPDVYGSFINVNEWTLAE